MFSTADLPADFRAPVADDSLTRAVRASGLRLPTCTHGRDDCPTCVAAAARALAEATTGEPAPVG